jgi:hypothetical protein
MELFWRPLADYYDQYCAEAKLPIDYECDPSELDIARCERWLKVTQHSNLILDACYGRADPSPFKRLAAAGLAVMIDSPIPIMIPVSLRKSHWNDSDFAKKQYFFPAVAVIDFCVEMLHNAEIGSASVSLKNRIELTNHFHTDLAMSLACEATECAKDGRHTGRTFHQFSLVLESCAYWFNPEAPKLCAEAS